MQFIARCYLFNCTERRSWLYLAKRMSLEGRRTRPLSVFLSISLSLRSPHPCIYPSWEPLLSRVIRTRAFIWMCAKLRTFFPREDNRRWIADRSRGTHSTLGARLVSSLPPFPFFFFSFTLAPHGRRIHIPGGPGNSGNAQRMQTRRIRLARPRERIRAIPFR